MKKQHEGHQRRNITKCYISWWYLFEKSCEQNERKNCVMKAAASIGGHTLPLNLIVSKWNEDFK